MTIYGGFAGTETSLEQRNIQANPTYLDGNVYYRNIHDFTDPENFYSDKIDLPTELCWSTIQP